MLLSLLTGVGAMPESFLVIFEGVVWRTLWKMCPFQACLVTVHGMIIRCGVITSADGR